MGETYSKHLPLIEQVSEQAINFTNNLQTNNFVQHVEPQLSSIYHVSLNMIYTLLIVSVFILIWLFLG